MIDPVLSSADGSGGKNRTATCSRLRALRWGMPTCSCKTIVLFVSRWAILLQISAAINWTLFALWWFSPVLTCLNPLPACLARLLSRCIWSAVGNLSTAISGGGDAEARRLVEDDLRYIDDDTFGSWIGGGGELSPREGEGASSVMQAVDEGISGLIRSAAHLRYENTHSEFLST